MVLLLASLAGHTTSAAPVVVGSVVDQPLLVAAAGLVVVLAILLVFVMVLRSGDNKRSSIGIGYDAQQGPLGQPKAPPSQPGAYGRGATGQGWPQGNGYGNNGYGSNGYAAPDAANGAGQGGWGAAYPNSWNDQAAAQPYQATQSPNWAAAGQPGQRQEPAMAGGWGQPQGGEPSLRGNWGQPAEPAAPAGWGQAQAPSQAPNQAPNWGAGADQGGGWSGAAAPAAPSQPNYGGGAPRGGGWTGGIGATDAGAMYNAPAYPDAGRQPAVRPASSDRGAVLTVRQGKDAGRTYEVRKDRMTIGRNRESDIFLEDLAVSRTHTSVGRDDRGRYIVRDENSANGTFVNNQRINGEQVLEDGDEIQIGQTVLAFSRH